MFLPDKNQEVQQFPNKINVPLYSGIHAPIVIDGNAALAAFLEKTGSGTIADPYIIANFVIDAGWSTSGIFIMNTTSFLVIRNNTVLKAGAPPNAGVRLQNVTNVQITNNSILHGVGSVINLQNSNYNSLQNNFAFNSTWGIQVVDSDFINCTGNRIENMVNHGIDLLRADNNLLKANKFLQNTGRGISLVSSNYVTIFGNFIEYNKGDAGIQIRSDVGDATNRFDMVRGNTVVNNSGDAIHIEWVGTVTVQENVICNNSGYGIAHYYTAGHTFWGNLLQNNSMGQGFDAAAVNAWDNGTIGNVWGDYLLKYPGANNNSFIWDQGYAVPGAAGSLDRYPLVNYDTILPTVTLLSPANGTTQLANYSIVVNASDNIWVKQVTYNWDGGANRSLDFTGTPITILLPNQDGGHTLNVYAHDIGGNWNGSRYFFNTIMPKMYQVWNCTWGGLSQDYADDIATDRSGNIFVACRTTSYGAGGADALLIKYAPNGTQLWNRTWGGGDGDAAMGVAVDPDGNAFITGVTWSFSAGSGDLLIVKYDPDGSQLWNHTWGGGNDDRGYDVFADSNGNAYVGGRTLSFGAGAVDAVLIKYAPNGTQLWYHTWGGGFDDLFDGIAPSSDGNVYVVGATASFGAGKGDLLIIKYGGNGTQLWNHTWGGLNDDAAEDVSVDGCGNIFVVGETNSYGAGDMDALIVKYSSNGTQVWNRTWGTAGGERALDIYTFDSGVSYIGGNLNSSGAGGWDSYVAKYDPDGARLWNITWGGGNDDLLYGIDADGGGNAIIVGDTFSFGAGADDVFLVKFAPYSPTGYDFLSRWGASGGNGSIGMGDGEFNAPVAVAINNSGFVYVIDANNSRIQVIAQDGQFASTWGSQGIGDGQFDFGTTWAGIAINRSGYVFIADCNNNRVQVFTQDGQFVGEWGDPGSDDGQFDHPSGIAVNASGFVYVTDTGNHRVEVFYPNGTFLAKWGSLGNGDGELTSPVGIAVDGFGKVYVADSGNNRVQVFTPGGQFLTKWGSLGTGAGQFSLESGICIAWSGEVYVTDTGNNRVQAFTPSGQFISKWGSFGLSNGQFNTPRGIAVNGSGYIFVADTGNNRVQVFTPNYGDPHPPPAPPLLSVIAPNPSTTGNITLIWSVPDGAVSYNIYRFPNYITQINGSVPLLSVTGNSTYDDKWLVNGTYYYVVTATNTSGTSDISNCEVIVVGNAPPAITVTSLVANHVFGANSPTFSLDIGGAGIDQIWYSLDEGLTNTTCGFTGDFSTMWSVLGNGTVMVTFWANDTRGNTGRTDILLHKDISEPSIILPTSWVNGTSFAVPPTITLDIVDSNLAYEWYTLGDDPTEYSFTGGSFTIDATAWEKLPPGSVTIHVYAEDSLGNIATMEIVVVKEAEFPVWVLAIVAIGAAAVMMVAIARRSHRGKDAGKIGVKEGNQVMIAPTTTAPKPVMCGEGAVLFISYKHDEGASFHVPEIATVLRQQPGIQKVLYSERDVTTNFVEYMDESLRECHVVILFCSPASIQSRWVKGEWTAAYAKGIPIVPVFMKTGDIPALLTAQNGVQFNPNDIPGTIKSILDVIMKITGLHTAPETTKFPSK